MKIGVLTGGGDCPGLNAVIRAVVRKGTFHYEDSFVGFMEGWRGLLEDKTMELGPRVGGRHSAARRHHPAHFAHQSGQVSRRPAALRGESQETWLRGADRHRRR